MNLTEYAFTIITLIIGVALDRGIDFVVSRKKIHKAGNQWLGEFKYFLSPIEKQIDNINTFLHTHDRTKFNTPVFGILFSLKGENFKSLNKSEFYDYLKRNKKQINSPIQFANELHVIVDIVAYNYVNIDDAFNTYKNKTSEMFDLFILNLNNLIKAIAHLATELEKNSIDYNDDPLFRGALTIQQNGMPKDDMGYIDIYAVNNDMIIPMIKHLSLYRTDERTNELRDAASQCSTYIKKIKLEENYLILKLEQIVVSLEKSKNKLISLLEKLNPR